MVERQTRISSISIDGDAAGVQVEMELSTYSYFDFLNLLKIDGRWWIVDKVYYKKNHA
ncbi:MAG: nuclear transport factor 2 family protein [Crocinitomicaceae bacterium]